MNQNLAKGVFVVYTVVFGFLFLVFWNVLDIPDAQGPVFFLNSLNVVVIFYLSFRGIFPFSARNLVGFPGWLYLNFFVMMITTTFAGNSQPASWFPFESSLWGSLPWIGLMVYSVIARPRFDENSRYGKFHSSIINFLRVFPRK